MKSVPKVTKRSNATYCLYNDNEPKQYNRCRLTWNCLKTGATRNESVILSVSRVWDCQTCAHHSVERGHSSGYPGSKDRKTGLPLPALSYTHMHMQTTHTVALLMAKTLVDPRHLLCSSSPLSILNPQIKRQEFFDQSHSLWGIYRSAPC